MLALVHLEQEEGWRLQTNPFFIQQEQGLIISPSREIDVANNTQHTDAKDLIKGIRNKKKSLN